MGIRDTIREATYAIRDELSNLQRELVVVAGQRDSADERAKRSGSEITRQRALLGERKRAVGEATERVARVQQELDDLERQRQQVLQELFREQEQQRKLGEAVGTADRGVEEAVAVVRREQRARDELDARAGKVREGITGAEQRLRTALLQALEQQMKLQASSIEGRFRSDDQRREALRAHDELRRARHSDPAVAQLCEQREELVKLLGSAVVPTIRTLLEVSLRDSEAELERRFPGSMSPPTDSCDGEVDELLFYEDRKGSAVFLLPIPGDIWRAAAETGGGPAVAQAMRIIWAFVYGLALTPEEGGFVLSSGWPAFRSHYSLEEAAVLEGFEVGSGRGLVARFVLSPVPAELQEALAHGNRND